MRTTRCSICVSPPKLSFVNRRLEEGRNFTEIEAASRLSKDISPIKRDTVAKHKRECLDPYSDDLKTRIAAQKWAMKPAEEPDDVAVLVQKEVVQRLKDGEARVTVQHGLQAQQIIDRRIERAKDRELAVTLARMLHTAPPPSDLIEARPVIVLEGEFEHVG